ncbi:hypothetical protein GBAR_LOCUS25255 [Geodia barretti]|uniref:Uncharacterized protein n=1 Tax=Geodia barretti TaxID=519541 RepID=A0AA35TCX6_GEOBA|nr:hypothetical protein GBAR_LOCUS25255 [Geodia barretti]
MRRHRRWSLSLQLDRLHKDTEKFVTAVELWCTKEEGKEWVPAANTVDAQLQLDSVQSQYNQLIETSDTLLAGGKTIAMETEQLDSVMFGSTQGPAHPVTTTISGLESKLFYSHVYFVTLVFSESMSLDVFLNDIPHTSRPKSGTFSPIFSL